ncbi:MAG: OsmC family protein [Candidatus Thermoplasmatota archaeon]
MEVKIKQVEGLTFIGKGESNHWAAVDGPKKYDGYEAASRPMELLLISLGSCTGSDVASILKKKRVDLEGFELKIEAEQSKDHPKVFTKIHIEFVFYGEGIDENDLERAIELSQKKYCPVSAMLREKAVISYSYQIKK